MKKLALSAIAAAGVAFALGAAQAQQKNVTIGVSIPAATHGWTGGVVYHAEEAAKRLEKTYPGLKVIVKTSPSGAAQANALEDLSAQKIDALVVLPFNSDELTNPVLDVKRRGTFITVVDRGLKDPTIQDIYVAGNNPEFGRVAGKYFADYLKQGNVVVLRGIPTVIDEERVTSFEKALQGSGVKILDKQYANWTAMTPSASCRTSCPSTRRSMRSGPRMTTWRWACLRRSVRRSAPTSSSCWAVPA